MEDNETSEIRERRQGQARSSDHGDRVTQTEGGWVQRFREDAFVNFIQKRIFELYLRLSSSDYIWQSMSGAIEKLKEAPASTMLFYSLLLFGFLPIVCFFMFVCATFILWLVCFIFFQAIAVILAAAVCGGLFVLVTLACCALATTFGFTIHSVSFMGELYRVLAFNTPQAVSYIRQQLTKLGIHIRLPQDDQA